MQYSALGSSGVKVSSLGLGLFLQFKDNAGNSLMEQHIALIDAAFEGGINYFDTANAYAEGQSEEALGRWLKQSGASRRDQVLIGTKFKHPVRSDNHLERGLSRKNMIKSVEESLRRLNTDYIDIYCPHSPDGVTSIEEMMWSLDILVRSGKIRYVGLSNFLSSELVEALWICDRRNFSRPIAMQDYYNMIEWGPELELIPTCQKHNVGFMGFSPLAGGFMTGKYSYEQDAPDGSRYAMWIQSSGRKPTFWRTEVFSGLEKLRTIATAKGIKLHELAHLWVMSNANVNCTIVGPKNVEHLNSVIALMEQKLDEEERISLRKSFLPAPFKY